MQLPAINIPGQLIGTSADNRYAYTVESWWDTGASRNTVRMHALEISGNRAYLRSSTDLDGYVNNVDITGTTAVTTSQWNGEVTRADGTKYWDNKTNLVAIDLSNPRAIHVAGRTQIPMDWGYLQKVKDGRAFVGSGPGVFTYIVSDPANLKFEAFHRTQGWAQEIIVAGNKGYMPSGSYGVQILDLPAIPQN